MKRGLLIAAVILSSVAAAWAREYTNLDPPTLAVMDFEVSMGTVTIDNPSGTALKELNKAFYGQLISQALLSVLVQQNASSIVITPKYVPEEPNSPLYRPGSPVYDPGTPAREAEARKKTAKGKDGEGQDARYYFPPIFKIFDKKYVENALQNGNFTTKDLYTKAVGAFNFADLDYLVLGNVYETSYEKQPAIGFNVRVLNTKRAEELYSYSAIVDQDLHDLPNACAQICRCIMLDILNSHCAQFTITESSEITTVDPNTGEKPAVPPYTLFWQPRQVEKDDNTVGDSDHSNKREVNKNQFYWTLPGQYIISVYNKETQQIREVPFTIASGALRNITIEKQYLDTQKGAITIGGVAPTSSYTFELVPKKQREQYWWEIFTPPLPQDGLTVDFQNGEFTNEKTVSAEYHPATQEILITNVPFATYDMRVTRNPPAGQNGIMGLWLVQSKLSVRSPFIPVVLQDTKGVKLQIADFGLQEKKALEAPQLTKVTFILNPGFGFNGWLEINDNTSDDWLYWTDREKITVTSEYSQADWDAQPDVTYTVYVRGVSRDGKYSVWGHTDDTLYMYHKKQLIPSRDTVVFVDLNKVKTDADAAANKRASAAAQTTQAAQTSTTSLTVTQAASGQKAAAPAAPAAPAARASEQGPSKLFMDVAAGLGYGKYNSITGGLDANVSATLLWYLSPAIGLGPGLMVDIPTSEFNLNYLGTVNLSYGDLSKGRLALLVQAGAGTGYEVGAGCAFLNAKKNGGTTLRIGYYHAWTGTNSVSLFLDLGYMFGF